MYPELELQIPAITLDIHVPDIEKTLTLYDRLEVWRSNDNTSFTEITSSWDLPAAIDGTVEGPWPLVGTTLSISKNTSQVVNISFTSMAGYDLQSLINIINPYFYDAENQNYKIASQVPTNTNRLRLVSDLDGWESNITVGGTAAIVLGLSTTKSYGKLHRTVLTYPTTRYRIFDTSAENQLYYYKVRFSHSKTGRISDFSTSIPSKILPVLQDSDMVTCYGRLADNQGLPIRGRRVILVVQQPKVIGASPTISSPLVGVMEERIEMVTDQFGYFSTKVPKNTFIKVYFEGSLINRIINSGVVDFDLLDEISTTPDPFNLAHTENLAPVVTMFP